MVKLPINILLVDDERDFVEMLSLRLTEAGHRVRTAFSDYLDFHCQDFSGAA